MAETAADVLVESILDSSIRADGVARCLQRPRLTNTPLCIDCFRGLLCFETVPQISQCSTQYTEIFVDRWAVLRKWTRRHKATKR